MSQNDPGNAESEADRELIVTRVFDAPAAILFVAHSKPQHVKRWFGPKGWPLTRCDMDFREGGRFHFQMTGDNGEIGPPFGGTYLEIVENRRIVYDNGFDAPGSGRMRVTVTFEEADGRTTLVVSTIFDTIDMKNEYVGVGMAEGMHSGFDNLEELLKSLKGDTVP